MILIPIIFNTIKVQCVLSINIFTEKIYVIIWFWFFILSILTFIDLILFIFKNCLASQRYFYVKKHVLIFNTLQNNQQQNKHNNQQNQSKTPSMQYSNQLKLLNNFSNKTLKPDIILVLKIIAANVNGLVVSELVKYLWESFLRVEAENEQRKGIEFIQDYDYGDPSENEDEEDAAGADEKMNATPAFPINREPAGSTSSATAPLVVPNKSSGIRSILRLNSKSSDTTVPKQQDDQTKTIKATTGDKQPTNGSMV